MENPIKNINKSGIVKPSNVLLEICPHCKEKLSKTAVLQRKTKRTCKCRKCGQFIDERFTVF